MRTLCTVLTSAALLLGSSAHAGNLIEDTALLRKSDKGANLKLDPIVQKHITQGAPRDSVERYLRALDFTLHPGKTAAEPMYAIRTMRSFWRPFVDEEIQIRVEFADGRVSAASGRLILRGL